MLAIGAAGFYFAIFQALKSPISEKLTFSGWCGRVAAAAVCIVRAVFAVVLVLVLVGVGVLVGRLLGFGFFGLLGVVGESRVTKR